MPRLHVIRPGIMIDLIISILITFIISLEIILTFICSSKNLSSFSSF